MPTHWLVPHLSSVLRAWALVVEGGEGGAENMEGEEEYDEDYSEEWMFLYAMDEDYYDKEDEDE